jgi:hypothetical protein
MLNRITLSSCMYVFFHAPKIVDTCVFQFNFLIIRSLKTQRAFGFYELASLLSSFFAVQTMHMIRKGRGYSAYRRKYKNTVSRRGGNVSPGKNSESFYIGRPATPSPYSLYLSQRERQSVQICSGTERELSYSVQFTPLSRG